MRRRHESLWLVAVVLVTSTSLRIMRQAAPGSAAFAGQTPQVSGTGPPPTGVQWDAICEAAFRAFLKANHGVCYLAIDGRDPPPTVMRHLAELHPHKLSEAHRSPPGYLLEITDASGIDFEGGHAWLTVSMLIKHDPTTTVSRKGHGLMFDNASYARYTQSYDFENTGSGWHLDKISPPPPH